MKIIASIAFAVALLLVGGLALARRTDQRSAATPMDGATDLPVLAKSSPPVDATGWLNTAPLKAEDLRGKVVLYDFWTYACINCQHTLPYVKTWYARYKDDGLVVLSVHSPELEFEADPANVAAFVADHGIKYPVALDPHHTVWRAFGNHYWPAFYVDDRSGERRYEHFGEGRYDETEDVLRELLGVDPSSPRAQVERA